MRIPVLAMVMALVVGLVGCTSNTPQPVHTRAPATESPPPDPFDKAQQSVVLVSWDDASTVGTVLSADGLVLTTQPPTDDEASSVTVALGEQSHSATLVAGDPRSRLAIVQIETSAGLTPAVFGDTDQVAVGDEVRMLIPPGVAPDGASPAATPSGQIRLTGRVVNGMSLIETDPLVPAGADARAVAGGVLVNASAEVIGVVVGTTVGSDPAAPTASLALPSNTATRIAAQLVATGEVRYAYLGLVLQPEPDGGARVEQVTAGSPAERAGLRTGDAIEEAGGIAVSAPGDLVYAVQSRKVGDTLTINFRREGTIRQVEVILGETPDP
jgi:putative serine protease PepD